LRRPPPPFAAKLFHSAPSPMSMVTVPDCLPSRVCLFHLFLTVPSTSPARRAPPMALHHGQSVPAFCSMFSFLPPPVPFPLPPLLLFFFPRVDWFLNSLLSRSGVSPLGRRLFFCFLPYVSSLFLRVVQLSSSPVNTALTFLSHFTTAAASALTAHRAHLLLNECGVFFFYPAPDFRPPTSFLPD